MVALQDGTGKAQLEERLAGERSRLVGLCALLTGSHEAAEDLAQETLLEAWRHRDRLYDPTGVSPWTSAIARNVCKRWAQERRRRPTSRWVEVFGGCDEPSVGELADSDLEVELEREELASLLDRAMDMLTPRAREILIQRFIEDRSHAEIAERLGVSEGAVRVTLHRGKLSLKHILAGEFAGEAAPYGAFPPEIDSRQETRIWCPLCGTRRFTGRLDRESGDFELRCPDCYPRTGMYARYTSPPLFEGVNGYKAAFNRVMRFVVPLHREALAGSTVRCPSCERGDVQLRLFLPRDGEPNAEGARGLHLRCAHCQSVMKMRLSNLALYQPLAWEFWRDHPRIQLLPERSIEVDGRPALVLSYESVRNRARLDVVLSEASYEILSIHQAQGG